MIALRVLRGGSVVREAVFRELPVTLGRGPESAFPIADASVSRAHACLERDVSGLLVLRDLGSRNGLHVGPRRVESVAVAGRLRCLVGAVEVEIEEAAADITQEIRLHDWRRFERRRGVRAYLGYLALGVLGWLAGVIAEPGFWSPWEKARGIAAFEQALGALVSLPVLSLLLLVLFRALGRRVRLADTLRALALLVWLLPLAQVLGFLAYYVLPSSALPPLRAALGMALGAWAAARLAAIRRVRPSLRLRVAWALAVVAIAAGFAFASRLSAQRAGQPDLDFHVQAPLFGYAGRAVSPDDYFAAFSAIATQAAEQAAAQRAAGKD